MVKLSADEYTFEEAFVDLAEFFHAGTLQAAIVSIANAAGQDAENALERTENIEVMRTATIEDVRNITEIRNALRELFRGWDAVRKDQDRAKPFLDKAKKALTELNVPFTETDTGDAIFNSLNEQIRKAVADNAPDRNQLKKLSDAFKKAGMIN